MAKSQATKLNLHPAFLPTTRALSEATKKQKNPKAPLQLLKESKPFLPLGAFTVNKKSGGKVVFFSFLSFLKGITEQKGIQLDRRACCKLQVG